MIIFNLYAIAVVIVVSVILVPFAGVMELIFPGIAENSVFSAVLFALATIIAGGCEAAGLRGRLFFIPMWLIGVVATVAKVYENFGGFTLAGSAIALLGGLVTLAYFIEKSQWKNAPANLAKCQSIRNLSSKEFWEHFREAFFVPAFGDHNKYVCYHNYQCLELLKNLGVDWPVIDPVLNDFAANTHDGNEIEIDSEEISEIEKLIQEQLESFVV